jgi:hypothetical protein
MTPGKGREGAWSRTATAPPRDPIRRRSRGGATGSESATSAQSCSVGSPTIAAIHAAFRLAQRFANR